MIARNDQGIEIWRFDTAVGEWRPAIGADGLPEVLTDLRSPLPNEDVRGSWKDPALFGTIQTADLYKDSGREIIANGPSGTAVWRYAPPAGSKSINGGTWSLVSTTSGLLPTPPAPNQYLSFHAIGAGAGPAVLTAQGDAYWTFGDNSFHGAANSTLAPPVSDPSLYLDNMPALMPESHSSSRLPNLVPANVYRTPDGVAVQRFDGSNWVQLGPPPTGGDNCLLKGNCSPFSNDAGPGSWWPSNLAGFNTNPAYYETMRVANYFGGPRDTAGYVLGRVSDGLHVVALAPNLSPPYGEGWIDAGYIPPLKALSDPSEGVMPPPAEWSSIRTGDVSGDGKTEVLAVVDGKLRAWELTASPGAPLPVWSELPADSPVNLGSVWQDDASYYSTIQVGPVAGPGYPDAVIARGPFGIRAWFYCTGGASQVPGCASLQARAAGRVGGRRASAHIRSSPADRPPRGRS